MSPAAHNGDGQGQRSDAEITARFTLHADRGESLADAAAELIGRLQKMANLPRCAYELDVDVQLAGCPAGARARRPGRPRWIAL